MSTEYAGNPSYTVTITIPTDDDEFDAASVAVPLEQLADRAAYLKDRIDGGVGFEFTDAILHGNTTFPDGTIVADVTTITLGASGDIIIFASDDTTIGATDQMVVSGDTLTLAGTVAVNVNTAALNVRGGQFTAAAGAIQIGGGADVITITGANVALGNTDLTGGASCSVSLGGTNVLTSTSANELEAGGTFAMNGKLRLLTTNRSVDFTADGTTGYEHIFTDDPAADRNVTLNHTGAAIGQRVRFNAQNVTGPNKYIVARGAQTWFMSNQVGDTVILEFVSDGSAWVVDDWQEGGSGLRNG